MVKQPIFREEDFLSAPITESDSDGGSQKGSPFKDDCLPMAVSIKNKKDRKKATRKCKTTNGVNLK